MGAPRETDTGDAVSGELEIKRPQLPSSFTTTFSSPAHSLNPTLPISFLFPISIPTPSAISSILAYWLRHKERRDGNDDPGFDQQSPLYPAE